MDTTLTPTFPPELQTDIVKFLFDCPPALRACAMSASSLRAAAQINLFYDITIQHPCTGTDDPPSDDEDEIYACAAFGRLAEVIAVNPGLRAYIRLATITAYVGVVAILADINLSDLRELKIYSSAADALDGPLIEPLRRLISLESLTYLNICGDFSAHIFSDCTSNLTQLSFEFAEEDSGEDMAMLAPDAQCPMVKHLCLYRSPYMTDWLMDSQCPFDFTNLVELSISMCISDGIIHLLDAARECLRTLSITLGDLLPAQLDFACFPALAHVNLVMPSVCFIVDILPSLANLGRDNFLQAITFRVAEFCGHAPAHVEARLKHFDTTFTKLPLPALQAVSVLLPRAAQPSMYSEMEATLRRAMPVLEQRQLLRVRRDYR